MKSCKGFTLIDAMLGMSIFMFTVLWITPILLDIYKERISIGQGERAIELTHGLLQEWKLNRTIPDHTPILKDGVEYFVTWKKTQDELYEICIDWIGANGREKSVCAESQ